MEFGGLQQLFEEKAVLQHLAANGGLTEVLFGHLSGYVGPHQHADVYAHLLSDDVRGKLQALGALVYALDQAEAQGLRGDYVGNLITDGSNELVWGSKYQQVCILHSLAETRGGHYILW